MKKFFSSLKQIIYYLLPTKKEWACIGIIFLSFLMIFAGGSINSKTKVEQISYEIADVVKGGDEAYLFCKGKEKSITSNERFSQYVNDRFFDIAPFRSVIGYNFDKSVECQVLELGNYGVNPSFLTSNYFTNHMDKGKIIFDRYFFELLYKDTNTDRSGGYDNFVYITKTQADYLISNNNEIATYDDVINTKITINVNEDISANWKVANIINDDGIFCEGAKKAFGNYLICFTLVPEVLRKTELMLFSMSDSNYLNIDYISLLENYFPINEYEFYAKEDVSPLVKLSAFLNTRDKNYVSDVLSTLLIIVGVIPFVGFGFFLVKQNIIVRHIFEFIFVSFFVWLIFFIIFKISKSIVLFSFVSLVSFFIIFIVFLLWIFILWLIKNYVRTNTKI